MARAQATVVLPGLVSEAEALWYDTARWPSFVDGLEHVLEVRDGWPGVGSGVTWESHPGGRGRVSERVVAYEPRRGQESVVEDETTTATQRVGFAVRGETVVMTLELEYRLRRRSPVSGVVDVLFVRRAQNDSLRRTLERFRRELGGDGTP